MCLYHFSDIQDIYKGNGGTNRRTLLIGEPGIGKTVVCLKHLMDYIDHSSDPIHGIEDYDLVILVEMRHASLPIESSIYRQRFPEDSQLSEHDMWSVIKQFQSKVLFIFDGFDELPKEVSQEWTRWIKRVLIGRMLSEVKVLLTSRMHQVDEIEEHFDDHFVNLGYRKTNSQQFVQNFFKTLGVDSSNSSNMILEKIHNDPLIAELAKNPLSLTLLCLLMQETNRLPKSITQLYDVLVHSLLSRHTKDRFQDQLISSQLIEELEELAYRKIKSNQIIFDYDLIENKEVCDLGFFCTKFTTVYLIEKKFCEFIHQSFQDYFAARQYRSCSQREQMAHIQSLVNEGRLHLMCQYICGLLPSAHPTLDAIVNCLCYSNCAKHEMIADGHRRGKLQDYQLSIRCLSEMFNSKANSDPNNVETYTTAVEKYIFALRESPSLKSTISKISASLPDILEITYSQCSLVLLEMASMLLRDGRCGVRCLKLCIDGFHQQPAAALELARAINVNNTISTLGLKQCFMDDTPFFISFMLTILENNSSISVLKLIGWMNKAVNLTEQERRQTTALFSAIQVKTLILEDFDNHRRVGYILDCFPPCFHTIEILNCCLETAIDAFVRKIKTTRNLQSIYLKNDGILRPCMDNILQALQTKDLTSLTLSSIYASHSSKTRATAVFTIEMCDKLNTLLKNCTSLKRLELSEDCITDEGGQCLCTGLHHAKQLEHLDLSKNELSCQFAHLLSSCVHSSLFNLKSLNISHNAISDGGFLKIAAAVQSLNAVKRLDISSIPISDYSCAAFRSLVDSGVDVVYT